MGTDFNESILMVNPEDNKNIRSKRQMQLFWMPMEGGGKEEQKGIYLGEKDWKVSERRQSAEINSLPFRQNIQLYNYGPSYGDLKP